MRGNQLIVTSPDGQRIPAIVGNYQGSENGYELHFKDEYPWPNALSSQLEKQGWKVPAIGVRSTREQEMQRLVGTVGEARKAGGYMRLQPMPTLKPELPKSKTGKTRFAQRRKTTHENMNHSPHAKQIVAALLGEELSHGDDREDFERRPGGVKDPWRQGGLKKFSFKQSFTGKRPKGIEGKPGAPATKPPLGKHADRMNWKPGTNVAPAPGSPKSVDLGKPKDRMKWKPTQEGAVPGTAAGAPAMLGEIDSMVPDPAKEDTDTAPTGPASPTSSPSAGTALYPAA